MSSFLIRGGRLVEFEAAPDRIADLYIVDGRIAGVGQAPAGFVGNEAIDASGCLVMPGLTDSMVRLPEPGHEHKGSIASELGAAVAGGVTDLIATPDTRPVIDNPALVRLLQERSAALQLARIHAIGAMTAGLEGSRLAEMYALQQAGCIGVSNLYQPLADNRTLLRCMEYAASSGISVFLAPSDAALAAGGCAHAGAVATRLGLRGIPVCAETVALARDLQLVEQTGVQAHIMQVSSARSVALISEAQARGLPVTAGVSIHHLLLNETAIDGFNSQCHLLPPLREESDRIALVQGVRDGTICAICSDHQPHESAAKHAPFAAAEAGASGVELLLPLAMRLVDSGQIELATALHALGNGPRSLTGRGEVRIEPGSTADLCIFDPAKCWELNADTMHSAGANSPFTGQQMQGRVRYTISAGRIVFRG